MYLDSVTKPVIPSDFMLNSTKSFLNKLADIDLSDKNLVSFDVESVFTNVPLAEVIEIACDLVYSDRSMSKPSYIYNYDKVHFRKLLQFDCHFWRVPL